MSYTDITTRDRNPIKRWLQRRRFSNAIGLIDWASPREDLRILDYGAGNGELIRQIEMVREIDAWVYEPTSWLMAEARENLSGLTSVTFADSIADLQSSSFDYVFCLEVLEHLPDRELLAVMSEIQRLLRPDGVALVGVPHELFLPALVKGAFRAARRYGEFDTVPRNIMNAVMGRAPSPRPASEIAPGFAYHFHHLGFDFRTLDRKLREHFHVEGRWFSPFPLLGLFFNSEVYFSLRKSRQVSVT